MITWRNLTAPFLGAIIARFLAYLFSYSAILFALAINGFWLTSSTDGGLRSAVNRLESIVVGEPWVVVMVMFSMIYVTNLAKIPLGSRLSKRIARRLASERSPNAAFPPGLTVMRAVKLIEATFSLSQSVAPLLAITIWAAAVGYVGPAIGLALVVVFCSVGFKPYSATIALSLAKSSTYVADQAVPAPTQQHTEAMRRISRPVNMLTASFLFELAYLVLSLFALAGWVWTAVTAESLTGGHTLFLVAGLGLTLRSTSELKASIRKMSLSLARLTARSDSIFEEEEPSG